MDGGHDDTAVCVPLTTSRDPSSLGKDRTDFYVCVGWFLPRPHDARMRVVDHRYRPSTNARVRRPAPGSFPPPRWTDGDGDDTRRRERRRRDRETERPRGNEREREATRTVERSNRTNRTNRTNPSKSIGRTVDDRSIESIAFIHSRVRSDSSIAFRRTTRDDDERCDDGPA